MSGVVLMTRRGTRIEHLGTWAYDRDQHGAPWASGRWIALCGADDGQPIAWHVTEYPEGPADGTTRRPLCSKCRRRLAELNDLAARRTP